MLTQCAGMKLTHLGEGIREIARQLGCSRNTVRRYLREQQARRYSRRRAVLGSKLLVVDEMGYLPFGREEANLFFNVVAKRHERGSLAAPAGAATRERVRRLLRSAGPGSAFRWTLARRVSWAPRLRGKRTSNLRLRIPVARAAAHGTNQRRG